MIPWARFGKCRPEAYNDAIREKLRVSIEVTLRAHEAGTEAGRLVRCESSGLLFVRTSLIFTCLHLLHRYNAGTTFSAVPVRYLGAPRRVPFWENAPKMSVLDCLGRTFPS